MEQELATNPSSYLGISVFHVVQSFILCAVFYGQLLVFIPPPLFFSLGRSMTAYPLQLTVFECVYSSVSHPIADKRPMSGCDSLLVERVILCGIEMLIKKSTYLF